MFYLLLTFLLKLISCDGFYQGNGLFFASRRDCSNFVCVTSVTEFQELLQEGKKLYDLDVRGNLDEITDLRLHPVIKLLHSRKHARNMGNSVQDGLKLGIAIEGGGMRGCVAAGMVTALWYLGLDDCVDVVYGSSAGSLIGAYFITKQLPYDGPQIYYKFLTSAGRNFIDVKSLLRSCGLGLFDLRPSNLIDLATDRIGRPVLNLNYLLDNVIKSLSPLNWPLFAKRQTLQPLKSSVILSADGGHLSSIDDLATCLKASMLLPGVSGPPVQLKGKQLLKDNLMTANWTEFIGRRKKQLSYGSEPLLDAQLFEPIPYRSAIKENCTHILVFRTRADGKKVTKKLSFIEKLMLRRYFRRKLKLNDISDWMLNQKHKEIYAEDILRLNYESRNLIEDGTLDPKMCCIALPRGTKEVSRMEMSKKVIFENIRDGFAVAFNHLVEDQALQGKGRKIAEEIWPDELLNE